MTKTYNEIKNKILNGAYFSKDASKSYDEKMKQQALTEADIALMLVDSFFNECSLTEDALYDVVFGALEERNEWEDVLDYIEQEVGMK